MMARFRPLLFICFAALLSACASSPSSTLGELPRTPQASTQELLKQAEASDASEAALLRLSAADKSLQQGNLSQTRQILDQVQLDQLKPAQQVFARTLEAELALAEQDPARALAAFEHPAFERLAELPVDQQLRSQIARAKAFEANDQLFEAARERTFIAPMLSGEQATRNHDAIWALVSKLPEGKLQPTDDSDLSGWLSLAMAVKQAGTLGQQQRAVDAWVAQNPEHPAARTLPEPLEKLRQLADKPLSHVALLLPMDGSLANVARALRDGFLAAHLEAGDNLRIELFDSTRIASLDDFYRQASAAGVELVVGPLDKELVRQLAARDALR